jgi:hypothetical protein
MALPRADVPFRWRLAAALPAVALVTVAATQITLARRVGLTPWKGGGFGMFSTTDDAGHRLVRIFVSAPERSEEIAVSRSLEDAAQRAATLPSDRQLTRLARLVVNRERRHGRPVRTVRIECWRTQYAVDTLAGTSRRLRGLEYRDASPVALR